MSSKSISILNTIMDRRLYGSGFFMRSLPFALIILTIQSYEFVLFSPQMLSTYVLLFVLIIAISALPAKNVRREFHPMDWWLAYLFMVVSILGAGFAFSIKIEMTPLSYLQTFLALIIPQVAIVISFMTIVVIGQRISNLGQVLGCQIMLSTKPRENGSRNSAHFQTWTKYLTTFTKGDS